MDGYEELLGIGIGVVIVMLIELFLVRREEDKSEKRK